MKTMERNKQTFYYALFDNETDYTDEYGNETGEKIKNYEKFVEMRANISSSTGEAQIEQFGTSLQYDKVIVTDDMSCPIDEYSVLCVDTSLSYGSDDNPIYDYVVKKVAKSLNSISIAISKVQVS